jgi:hypothetical protein
MPKWSCQSAQIHADFLPGGTIECSYAGVITREIQAQVVRATLAMVAGSPAGVMRTERAVFTDDRLPVPPRDLYEWAKTPVALVASEDRFEYWSQWAEMLGREFGLVRAVFLPQYLDLAREWAECHALVAISRLPPSRVSRRDPCPGDPVCQTTLQSAMPLG